MYILAPNGTAIEYPYGMAELRRDNPQTSFPVQPNDTLMAEFGAYPVQPTDQPLYDPKTEVINEGQPKLVGGVWVQTWDVRAKTAEEVQADLLALQRSIADQTQARLDTFARTRNYDGILSACTYATSSVPRFASEGQYCVDARDATWAALYAIMAEVETGVRPIPNDFDEIEPELPELVWPA